MQRVIWRWAFVAVIASGAVVRGHNTDFSGTWRPDLEATTLPEDRRGEAATLTAITTIRQTATTIVKDTVVNGQPGIVDRSLRGVTYNIDGTESGGGATWRRVARWAVASIGLFAAAAVGMNRSAVGTFVAAVVLGGLALGLPLYAAAARTGGRRPQLEAAAWTALAAVTAVLFFAATRNEASSANPVTLDGAGAAVSRYSLYPPELVWGVRCLAIFALGAGLASAAINSHAAGLRSVVWRGLTFGLCIAAILAACLLTFAIGGAILLKVVALPSAGAAATAFVTGSVSGAWIWRVRSVLITPLSRH